MAGRRSVAAGAGWALVAGALATGALDAPTQAEPADPFTVTTLHFKTTVGPREDHTCDVVGDLYVPRTASRSRRVPALLTTNGFGGSKDDQAGVGRAFASRGYVVLSYSGLGFGGSGCKITLDDPDFDGRAASQLVSYLGGASGIAYADAAHSVPAPALDVVRLDTRDHAGRAAAHDPRVGMVGGSYGGAVQLATAAVDPRLDTIVPLITWNDLSYSLAPNNTSQITADGVSTVVPGAAKLVWALGFSALGMVTGAENASSDPTRLVGCPNLADFVCPALVTAAATGTLGAGAVESLRHASVTSYVDRVRVPTFLIQGESDTLFNLNEAAATFEALRRQGTPVAMAWSQFGHSGPAAPGELDLAAPAGTYLGERVIAWFEHYLQDRPTDTGPLFSYFRDWVPYSGSAAPAYAPSASFPVTGSRTLYLSGSALVDSAAGIEPGSQVLTSPPAGLPTSTDPLDVLGDAISLPEADLPGTVATFTTAPLERNVDVVGSPVLHLQVDSLSPDVTLFAKILDVDPSGRATLIRNLVAPTRVTAPGRAVTVRMPAIVHRFAPGHRIRLAVAGGSVNYRGGLLPSVVGISTGSSAQRLRLPVPGAEPPASTGVSTPPRVRPRCGSRARRSARAGACGSPPRAWPQAGASCCASAAARSRRAGRRRAGPYAGP